MRHFKAGFTLIELLVVIMILGIILAITMFALSGARSNAVDERKKADLHTISSALEKYRSDCNKYPASLTPGASLVGDGSTPTCKNTNTYIEAVPADLDTTRNYSYVSVAPYSSYILCASLANGSGSIPSCGSCGAGSCNYSVVNP